MIRKFVPIMTILALFFFYMLGFAGGVSIAAAQDSTPEVTAEQTPVVVIAATPAPVEQHPSIFSPSTLGELALFLGLAVFAGGGIATIILTFLGKKEVRDRVEDARNSWSPEQQKMLADFTGLFANVTTGILDFLSAVQDGKPNVDGSTAMQSLIKNPHLSAAQLERIQLGLDTTATMTPNPLPSQYFKLPDDQPPAVG